MKPIGDKNSYHDRPCPYCGEPMRAGMLCGCPGNSFKRIKYGDKPR